MTETEAIEEILERLTQALQAIGLILYKQVPQGVLSHEEEEQIEEGLHL